MYIITSAILLLLGAVLFISFCLCNAAIHPKTLTYENICKRELESGRIKPEDIEFPEKETVVIKSPYRYELHGLFFPCKESKKAVILCHGITCNIYSSVKYMGMFVRRGYNVFIYDHRNHGKSGGSFTTYGCFEKHDLKACTDWVFERCGKDCAVGTHGESMGAATVLLNTGIDERLSFCIADCPYSDLVSLFKIRLKKDYHLPAFPFMHLASFVFKLKTGTGFPGISPIKVIENVKTPLFFIHGQEDTYIPKEMSIDMYNAAKGVKKLYLAPGAGHAGSYAADREAYDSQVGEFLAQIGL